MPIDCYECRGLGDDYYIDADGELASACDGCPNHETLVRDNLSDALTLLREQSSDKNRNAHGKWIRLTGMAPPEYHGHKICSVCECFAPYDPLHPWREMLTPYCPGCGAKMEVKQNA